MYETMVENGQTHEKLGYINIKTIQLVKWLHMRQRYKYVNPSRDTQIEKSLNITYLNNNKY